MSKYSVKELLEIFSQKINCDVLEFLKADRDVSDTAARKRRIANYIRDWKAGDLGIDLTIADTEETDYTDHRADVSRDDNAIAAAVFDCSFAHPGLSGSDTDDDEVVVKKAVTTSARRKSARRSVCVPQRKLSSSESSEDEEVSPFVRRKSSSVSEEESIVLQREHSEEEEEEEVKRTTKKKKKIRVISDDNEDDSGDEACSPSTTASRIASSSGEKRNRVEEKKKKRVLISDDSDEELPSYKSNTANWRTERLPSDSDDESNESEGSLKNFIIDDDEEGSNGSADGDSEDDGDGVDVKEDDVDDVDVNDVFKTPSVYKKVKTTQSYTKQTPQVIDESEDSGSDDDELFQTPSIFKSKSTRTVSEEPIVPSSLPKPSLPKPSTSVLKARNVPQPARITPVKQSGLSSSSSAKTPRSAISAALSGFALKSCPGTSSFQREFKKNRDEIVRKLLKLYNSTVFDDKLPSDLSVTWNARLLKTAGYCFYSTLPTGEKKSRIELSEKVVDEIDRIRDTLIHEMCHAATWVINGKQDGHGPVWKHWALKANRMHPELPVVMRCHNYEVKKKYIYKCNGCGQTFGRHSKSIDSDKQRCTRCGGVPLLETPQRTPSKYNLYVKEHYSAVKRANPALPNSEVMKLIGAGFRELKVSSTDDKENSPQLKS